LYPKHIEKLQYSEKHKVEQLENYKNLSKADKINRTYGEIFPEKLTEKGILEEFALTFKP